MTESARRTPLHRQHVELGGRMVPFAGFSLPIHYPTGIQEEHRAVRESAGLFDVSHMGRLEVEGPGAVPFVQFLTVNDAEALDVGQAQYSALCRSDGGVIDDLLVYRTGASSFLLIVNAARHETDLAWIRTHAAGFDVSVTDRTQEHALLALQGPRAEPVLEPLTETSLEELDPFRFVRATVAGAEALLSRTGYTGEDGFEIRVAAEAAGEVWSAILGQEGPDAVKPAGLGARDILRLEVGYPLYGADLDEMHTALEAGLGWVVKLGKGDFLGRDALARQREEGVGRRLVGILLEERGFPRPGYPVVVDGKEVGSVTSGTMSPALGHGIALAYLPVEHGEPETEVAIRIRGRDLAGTVVRMPFYEGGSRKR